MSNLSQYPNVSVFIRNMLLMNPNITHEEMVAEHERLGLPSDERPNPTRIRNLGYNLRDKYGVADIQSLPRKLNGDINVSRLIRLYLTKNPNATAAQTQDALALDGVSYSPALYGQMMQQLKGVVRSKKQKTAPIVPKVNEVDDLQASTPRARLLPKERSKPKKVVGQPTNHNDTYLAMEDQLDALMQQARAIENLSLVDALRSVRRQVIVGGAKLS